MQDGRDGIVIYHADQRMLVGISYKSVAHDLLMFHVGMNLDLVDDRLDTSVCQQFVHMMRIEVAHPDGTDLPHIDQTVFKFSDGPVGTG